MLAILLLKDCIFTVYSGNNENCEYNVDKVVTP